MHSKRSTLILILVALLASACSYSNTSSASMSCVFNGGPLDSKDFREFKDPGSGREAVGIGSESIDVPIRLVTYQISLDPAQGDTSRADSLTANIGGMSMQFEPTINMKFNTALDDDMKPVVCDLIETHLLTFEATDFDVPGGNWASWLDSRVRPSIDVAGVRALQRFDDPISMYFNSVVEDEELGYRDLAAETFGVGLTNELNAVLGGSFFCSPEHRYQSEDCGDIRVILPQPNISAADLEILAAPQRARTEANARIAEADEAARQAEQVAEARTREAQSAQQRADADELIALEEARTITVETRNDYEWCAVLRQLGEQCWLVAAAENGSLPQVLGDPGGLGVLVMPDVDPSSSEPAPEPVEAPAEESEPVEGETE